MSGFSLSKKYTFVEVRRRSEKRKSCKTGRGVPKSLSIVDTAYYSTTLPGDCQAGGAGGRSDFCVFAARFRGLPYFVDLFKHIFCSFVKNFFRADGKSFWSFSPIRTKSFPSGPAKRRPGIPLPRRKSGLPLVPQKTARFFPCTGKKTRCLLSPKRRVRDRPLRNSPPAAAAAGGLYGFLFSGRFRPLRTARGRPE